MRRYQLLYRLYRFILWGEFIFWQVVYLEPESINLPMKKTELCIMSNTIAVSPDVAIGFLAAPLFSNLLYKNDF